MTEDADNQQGFADLREGRYRRITPGILRQEQDAASSETWLLDEAIKALQKAMGHTIVGECFIRKLIAPSNVTAVAQIMHLEDLRKWMDETRPLLVRLAAQKGKKA